MARPRQPSMSGSSTVHGARSMRTHRPVPRAPKRAAWNNLLPSTIGVIQPSQMETPLNTTSHMNPGMFGPAPLLDLKGTRAASMDWNSEKFFDVALTLRSSPMAPLSSYPPGREFGQEA